MSRTIESLDLALTVASAISGGTLDRRLPISAAQPVDSPNNYVYEMAPEDLPDWSILNGNQCADGWRDVRSELGSVPPDYRACFSDDTRLLFVTPTDASAQGTEMEFKVSLSADILKYCRVNDDPNQCITETTRDIVLGSGGDFVDTGSIIEGKGVVKDKNGDNALIVYFSQDGDPTQITIEKNKASKPSEPTIEPTPNPKLVGNGGETYSLETLPALTATPPRSDLDSQITRETAGNFARWIKEWVFLNATGLTIAELAFGLGSAAAAFYRTPARLLGRYPREAADRIRGVFQRRQREMVLSAGMTAIAILEASHITALSHAGLAITPVEMAAKYSLGLVLIGNSAVQFPLYFIRNSVHDILPGAERTISRFTNAVEALAFFGIITNAAAGLNHMAIDPRQAAVGLLIGGLWLSKWLTRLHPIKV